MEGSVRWVRREYPVPNRVLLADTMDSVMRDSRFSYDFSHHLVVHQPKLDAKYLFQCYRLFSFPMECSMHIPLDDDHCTVHATQTLQPCSYDLASQGTSRDYTPSRYKRFHAFWLSMHSPLPAGEL